MRIADRENIHSVNGSGHPLGLACPCGRRALVTLKQLNALGSNMIQLDAIKFRCSHCGSYGVKRVIFHKGVQVDAFDEGLPFAEIWDMRFYGEDLNEWPAKMYVGQSNPYREKPIEETAHAG
jgi:hypothetical protein